MRTNFLALMLVGVLASVAMADDMVDNPQYKMWSPYKAGAMSKLEMNTATTVGDKDVASKVTMTTTLKELTAEKAVVEIVAEMDMNGQKMSMPAKTQEIPAKIAPAATQPAAPEGSKVTKKGEGDEEITVGGKKYKAHWIEYEMTGDKYEGTSKAWTADSVPGGTVKATTDTTKPIKSKTTIEVVDFKTGS